jgi:hypothetical protein
MRLRCLTCWKSVSNEVPEETVVRAVLTCPECYAAEHGIPSPAPSPAPAPRDPELDWEERAKRTSLEEFLFACKHSAKVNGHVVLHPKFYAALMEHRPELLAALEELGHGE